MGRRRARTRTSGAGFSLVELLIALAILTLVAGIAVTTLSGGQAQTAAREAAQRIAADMAFAQSDALAQRAARIVTFDAAAQRYGVYDGAGLLRDPVSHQPYEVDLATLFPGTGVGLASPDFGGEVSLRFDASGAPVAGGEVELHAAGDGYIVRVADVTGRITIEPKPTAAPSVP